MRMTQCLLVLLVLASSTAVASPIAVTYGRASDAKNIAWNRKLQQMKFLERIAGDFTRIVDVPPMRMKTSECGQANAFWNGNTRTMILCLELVREAEINARTATNDPKKSALLTGLTVKWVMAHELGHGLVDILKLPVMGREEDVADQIATLVLLHSKGAEYAISGAMINFAGDGGATWDVHAVNPQRRVNVACWALGSDARHYRYLVRHIPGQRRETCGEEYQQVADSFQRLLGKRLRIRLKGAGR